VPVVSMSKKKFDRLATDRVIAKPARPRHAVIPGPAQGAAPG